MADKEYMNREIEIKLDLGSFTNYLKLLGFLGRIEQEERHLNVFFDTEDRQISQSGWALRVRAENNRGLITIKSIPSGKGLAVVRQEIETEIPRSKALEIINLQSDVMAQEIMPIQFLKNTIGDVPVMRLVKFENLRQKKLFKFGECNYLMEVDKTEFSDGSVDYELELELPSTDVVDSVENQLRSLFNSLDIPFIKKEESKFHRALEKAKIF